MIIAKVAIAAILAASPAAAGHSYNVRAEQRYAEHLDHAGHANHQCLDKLWMRESGWNPWAVNPYSGAYGIPQALGHGNVFPLGKPRPQIRWGLDYVHARYGHSCQAWDHELGWGWY